MGLVLATGAAISAEVAEAGVVAAEAAELAAGIGSEAAEAGALAAEAGEAGALAAETTEAAEAGAGLATFTEETLGVSAEEAFGLSAEEAAIPEVEEFTPEFEQWYQSTFAEELEGLGPGEAEFDISADETLPEYLRPENMPQASTAGGGAIATETGFTAETEAVSPSIPTPESSDQLRDALHNITRTDIHDQPEGFSWADLIDQLQDYGWEFATQYFTKQDMKKIFKRVMEKITEKKISPRKDANGLIFLDPNGNLVPMKSLLAGRTYIDPFRLGYSVGRLSSHSIFAVQNRGQLTEGDLLKALTEGVKQYPEGHIIAPKVYQYIEASEEFRNPEQYMNEFEKVANVYDGNISEPFVKDGVIHVVDETGREIRNYGNDSIIIPPIWGEYGGLYSPNNKMPQDLLDTFFFLHDQGYVENGTFSKLEDMKLISRISHNMHRFQGRERVMAQFALHYFSHFGPVMSSFVHQKQLDTRIGLGAIDLYDYLIPQNKVRNIQGGYSSSGRQKEAIHTIRTQGKQEFYAGLEFGAQEALLEEAYKSGLGQSTTPNLNSAILQMFDNLVVTLS